MNRNKVEVLECHTGGLNSVQTRANPSQARCLSLRKRKLIWNLFFTITTILAVGAILTSLAIIRTKKNNTRSPIKITTSTTTTTTTTAAITTVKTLTQSRTTAATTTTTAVPLDIHFDSADRRFLFTMTNRSPYAFSLIESDRWFGHLEVPPRDLEAGNKTYTSILEIRGFRSTQVGTGVTYALCFRMDSNGGHDTGFRLNIYLQVGYHSSNYFGWTLREAIICTKAKPWYDNTQYDRKKANCTDTVLNKGGTLSLSASCNKMKIEMWTDNLSLSTPKLTIENA